MMRKLLFLLALVFAGPATLGAITSQASAQITCPKDDPTVNHLNRNKKDCESNCDDTRKMKHPESIAGCKKSCADIFDFCKKQFDKKAEDDKAAKKAADEKAANDKGPNKAAKEYTFHEKMACRKPYIDCLESCPKSGAANKTCAESCDTRLFASYEACQDKTGPLVEPQKR